QRRKNKEGSPNYNVGLGGNKEKRTRPGLGRASNCIQTRSLVTTATTAAAATAPATAAVAAATSTATTATAAARTFFPRPRNIDRQCAPAQFLAIQSVNGLLGLFRAAHGDEAETPRTSGRPVHHEVGFHDRAMLRKGILQVVFSDVEGKIP